MSWGAAAEGTSTAGSTAGSAASSGASSAGSSAVGSAGSSAAGPAMDVGAGSASNAGGYSIDAGQAGQSAQQSPSFMDNAMSGLDKFQKGSEQSLPEAWRERSWSNPGTYGYVAGKVQGMGGGGGGNQPASVTTNINYQQPQNDYLRRRRGY